MLALGEKVRVHDRKLKTHTFEGEIVGVDRTIENTVIYSVNLQLRDKDDKKIGKKIVTLLADQLVRVNNV